MSPPAPIPPSSRVIAAVAGVIVLAVLAVYGNGLDGPFVFDDVPAIAENPTIRRVSDALHPPSDRGLPVTGRPIVNLSLALNYAAGGIAPRGYHVMNVALHALTALLLFGVVRRTLLLSSWNHRFIGSATWVAGTVALLWAVHPLQTAAVSYVVQRAEILVSLFYLLTLYAFARSTVCHPLDDKGPAGWRALAGWGSVAVAAAAAGMATKEVMVSAPVIVWLYDRTFVAGSFREAWRRRWRLHGALGATWLLLAALMFGTGGRAGTAGFGLGISPWAYALKQCDALTHYLRLAFWPDALVFDYGGLVLVANAAEVVPQAMLLFALLAATAVALWRWPRAGFVGAVFFAVLAPTSSFVPLADTMFEHRMYLPLAAILVGIVLLISAAAQPRAIAFLALLAFPLSWLTIERNQAYRSELALWHDTVAKRPENVRAHYTLGSVLAAHERWADAIAEYERALRLRPDSPEANNNLGNALVQTGRAAEAVPRYEAALRSAPSADTHNNLANALQRLGRLPEARAHYLAALKLRPTLADAHNNLGNVLAQPGEFPAAIAQYQAALHARPDLADAHANLGNVLAQSGNPRAALAHYETALRLRHDFLDARFNLATALTELRRPTEAIAHYEEVLRRRADYPGAREQLARAQVMRDVLGK